MASMTVDEFVQAFHRASAKIKKRTFRKPKYAEASEEFHDLQMAMKREDCPAYAAFCAMAVARCEQALQRPAQAAWAFEEAGWFFWKSELELADVMGYSQKELVPLAVQCYEAAADARLRDGNRTLAGALLHEMARHLMKVHMWDEAADAASRAVALNELEQPISVLTYMQTCAEACFFAARFDRFSSTLERIASACSTMLASDRGTVMVAELERVQFRTRCVFVLALALRRQFDAACSLAVSLATDAVPARAALAYAIQDFAVAARSSDLLGIESVRSDLLRELDEFEFRVYSFVAEDLTRAWLMRGAVASDALHASVFAPELVPAAGLSAAAAPARPLTATPLPAPSARTTHDRVA